MVTPQSIVEDIKPHLSSILDHLGPWTAPIFVASTPYFCLPNNSFLSQSFILKSQSYQSSLWLNLCFFPDNIHVYIYIKIPLFWWLNSMFGCFFARPPSFRSAGMLLKSSKPDEARSTGPRGRATSEVWGLGRQRHGNQETDSWNLPKDRNKIRVSLVSLLSYECY